MEKLLKELFGLQHFVYDAGLQRLIDDTERRCGEDVAEDDLGLIAAAGDPSAGMGLPGLEELESWPG